MKKPFFILSILLFGLTSSIIAQELKAFPTAEGFGKFASGGRGGHVLTVTSLEDDSLGVKEGTFRWALNQYNSDFTIVFAVSGEIELVRDIRAKKKNFTIAGQTAPGDGIQFSKNALNFGGSENFIIRHIRARIGDMDINGDFIEKNSFIANNSANLIIDHCSFGWSAEENMNTYDNYFQTVQWCIIHEGLYNSGHKKGLRGYATQWGGSQTTYHHNLLAHHNSRTPRFNGAKSNDMQVFHEYINNVNYNWGNKNASYGGENNNGAKSIHELNMVNNYYKPGPATIASSSDRYFVRPTCYGSETSPPKWYIYGNVMEGSEEITEDNWKGVNLDNFNDKEWDMNSIRIDTLIIPVDSIRLERFRTQYHRYTYNDFESAEKAYLSVLAGVGARPLDTVDAKIVDEVREGTASGFGENELYIKEIKDTENGKDTIWATNAFYNKPFGIVDAPGGAGGYPIYRTEYVIPLDSDGDGIPDSWEREHGLNPDDPTDGNYVNSIGYTALEVYLSELVGENAGEYSFSEPVGIDVYESINSPLILVSNVVNKEVLIESTESFTIGAVYNTNGVRLMNVDLMNSNSVYVEHLSKGHYVLVGSTKDGAIRVARFLKN